MQQQSEEQFFEEEYLIIKYDTLANYLKQLNLHISVAVRDVRSNTKELLKGLINSLDKVVEEYNNFLISRRMHRNLYFKIDPIVFYKKESLHVISKQNSNFMLNLVFRKTPEYIYRMHAELWKKNGPHRETNLVLSKYEDVFMRDLRDKFLNDGYVSADNYISVSIKHNKPKMAINSKEASRKVYNDNLLNLLEVEVEKFLYFLNEMTKNKRECKFCNKYMLYDSKNQIFEPPTIKMDNSISKDKIDEKFYHEICAVKSFIPIKRNQEKA